MFKSELNARNKIAVINTLAAPVILYSYGVIDWKLDEIQKLDRMTRKQLCMNWMLAKKVDADRIYLCVGLSFCCILDSGTDSLIQNIF